MKKNKDILWTTYCDWNGNKAFEIRSDIIRSGYYLVDLRISPPKKIKSSDNPLDFEDYIRKEFLRILY